jgi:26S proteasome regulatory subunit N7
MAGEDDVLPIPNLNVAQYYFTLSNSKLAHLHAQASQNLLKAIEADGQYMFGVKCHSWLTHAPEMAPHFKLLLSQSPAILPSSLLTDAPGLIEKLEAKNKTTLEALNLRLEEAEKTEGETEISDALRAKAAYLTRIGDKVRRSLVA